MLRLLTLVPLIALNAAVCCRAQDAGTRVFIPQTQEAAVPAMSTARARAEQGLEVQRAKLLSLICPVGMAVQPGGMPQSVWVGAAEDAKAGVYGRVARVGVHLRLTGRQRFAAVQVSVVYRPAPNGVVPALAGPGLLREKTFSLAGGDSATISRNLSVGAGLEVVRVHVQRIEYENGNVWEAPSAKSCTAKLSRFLQVGGE